MTEDDSRETLGFSAEAQAFQRFLNEMLGPAHSFIWGRLIRSFDGPDQALAFTMRAIGSALDRRATGEAIEQVKRASSQRDRA